MISWYITFSFRFYYYTYRYSFVKYFNESPKECLKAVRSNDTIAAFLRTNLIHIHIIYIYTHIIYIYYIYTHIIYIYIDTRIVSYWISRAFSLLLVFSFTRATLRTVSSIYIDTCRSRRKIITRKQRTYETLDNETRCKAGRTLARVCVNRRRRTDWWSMRHKPEGAVLASAVKRGVRPRSSWLQESAWGDSSSSSGVANTGRQEPPNASGVFWAGWPFHSCRRTRRSLTGPKMLYIFHVDTGTTITFDIKLALQTWVSLH